MDGPSVNAERDSVDLPTLLEAAAADWNHRTWNRADHMNRFVAGDRAPSSPEGAKMLACTHPAFDGPVILFQDIIEILHGTVFRVLV